MAAVDRSLASHHPNDPREERRQIRMSAVKMSRAERESLLVLLRRRIDEIDRRRRAEQ